jgi:hypothetical protein
MRVILQIAAKDKAKAWGLLVRHSPGTALPDRTFIVSERGCARVARSGNRVPRDIS